MFLIERNKTPEVKRKIARTAKYREREREAGYLWCTEGEKIELSGKIYYVCKVSLKASFELTCSQRKERPSSKFGCTALDKCSDSKQFFLLLFPW